MNLMFAIGFSGNETSLVSGNERNAPAEEVERMAIVCCLANVSYRDL